MLTAQKQSAGALAKVWEDGLHSLRDLRNVIDIRNLGLMGAIELDSRPDAPGARAYEAMVEAFNTGLYFRTSTDVIALSPPLTVTPDIIDRIVAVLRRVLAKIP